VKEKSISLQDSEFDPAWLNGISPRASAQKGELQKEVPQNGWNSSLGLDIRARMYI
jgi:hypothetical protein